MSDNTNKPRACLDNIQRGDQPYEANRFVKISDAHYQSLVQDAKDLKHLRAALINGGASEEALQVLINSQQFVSHETSSPEEPCTDQPPPSKGDVAPKVATGYAYSANSKANKQLRGSSMPYTATTTGSSETGEELRSLPQQHFYETSYADRSLVIENLPKTASLQDLTKVIRGGMISNIYMRRKNQSAHVSFVEDAAAAQFFTYSQRHEIFINDQRVVVNWDGQQAFLPGWLISRIMNNGATRNLVIQFPRSDVTIETIKADLDHIYRLEVIDVKHEGGSFWISLNSIHLAIIAKDCMQSRLKYRSSKIEFFADECGNSLDPTDTNNEKETATKPTAGSTAAALPFENRFETLSLGTFGDDTEGSI